jgi:hypothetical protein
VADDINNFNAVMSLNLHLDLKCHGHQVQLNDHVLHYENYEFVYISVWLQSFDKVED